MKKWRNVLFKKWENNALCCTQCHSVLVCVTVYACWTWFVFLDVVTVYIFVGSLCFLVKTDGPTIIILWSEPRIAWQVSLSLSLSLSLSFSLSLSLSDRRHYQPSLFLLAKLVDIKHQFYTIPIHDKRSLLFTGGPGHSAPAGLAVCCHPGVRAGPCHRPGTGVWPRPDCLLLPGHLHWSAGHPSVWASEDPAVL